jgi:hypothetical protein
MMPDETLDEMMRDYADAAVELARDFSVTLDYSEESLQELGRIVAQLAEERKGLPAASAGGAKQSVEEQTIMMCKLWGGYLGEVVRRRWGGEWEMATYPGQQFATLTLNIGRNGRGGKLFPSIKIYRCLSGDDADGIWGFYLRVKKSLEEPAQQQ